MFAYFAHTGSYMIITLLMPSFDVKFYVHFILITLLMSSFDVKLYVHFILPSKSFYFTVLALSFFILLFYNKCYWNFRVNDRVHV
jgi:hypothetical protein